MQTTKYPPFEAKLPSVFVRALVLLTLFIASTAWADSAEPDIVILASVDEAVDFWKQQDAWGDVERGQNLTVPRALTLVINQNWRTEADSLPVTTKKELFYRATVPLILHANELLERDRERLLSLTRQYQDGMGLGAADSDWLRQLAVDYALLDAQTELPGGTELDSMIDELLLRVDVIPPALALGQAAYESGYGTSRFALQGNAFFGQWTWGGKGMRPKSQRSGKGDYKIATYDWPLDSVRGYMRNLNTQRAYADLRALRAEFRAQGVEPTGPALADGLLRYSERGQEYVDTLKGMIRVNQLDVADQARLRDEEPVLLIQAIDDGDRALILAEIDTLRRTGELGTMIDAMRLGAESE